MNWTKRRSGRPRRPGRLALLGVAAGAAMLVGACSSEPGTGGGGNSAGTLQLSSASGPTSSTPTWHTTVACPTGFQQSATFKEVHADGTTTNFIAPIVNGTAQPFSGTLQATIAQIQNVGGIANGGTQKWFVTCFSGQSGTGNPQVEMVIYITYSADGSTYTTSSTAPA